MRSVRERAPAKINLRLRILSRDPDGYHQLETLFQAIELHDSIEARIAGATTVRVEGDVDIGAPERNLALRAAHAFRDEVHEAPQVELRLVKRIPAGAGLGGGSSDAAATLRAMNRLSGEPLDAAALLDLGATLGSDVAFFLCGSSLAHATGRGERLVPMPAFRPVPVVVVDPAFPIATADAFAWWDEEEPEPRKATTLRRPDDFDALRPNAVNDFESVVFDRHPELGRIRDVLERAGATIARLSGSGSCVFGLFADDAPPRELDDVLRGVAPAARVLHTRTLA